MDETLAAETGLHFRSVNQRVRELVSPDAGVAPGFVCECLDERCFATVALTVAEFDAVCEQPDIYVVQPGHEDHDADEVRGRCDGYTLAIRAADVH